MEVGLYSLLVRAMVMVTASSNLKHTGAVSLKHVLFKVKGRKVTTIMTTVYAILAYRIDKHFSQPKGKVRGRGWERVTAATVITRTTL